MYVKHYAYSAVGRTKYRWKIVDEEGRALVQGLRSFDTLEESKSDVYIVGDFLAAVIAERSRV